MPLRLSTEEKDLVRRYLVWCFKTTKEDLDRIDRKFTQLSVDRDMLKDLTSRRLPPRYSGGEGYQHLLEKFKGYIHAKENDANY